MVRYHNSGTQKFDDTEHDSVNTEDATITNSLDATDLPVSSDGANPTRYLSFANGRIEKLAVEKTVNGDNTSVVLTTQSLGLIYVSGNQVGANGNRFSDILNFNAAETVSVVDSTDRGAILSRTYADNAGELQIAIDDAGESYRVQASVIGGGVR